ncbi:hypothetical protein Tco_0054137 [Tanacetum coccineum]
MSMTIQSSVKDKILATSSETSKVENAPAEMLRDLDQQMEKRADDGKANVVTDALSRKERVKPRRVRAMAMIIQYGVRGMILAAQSEAFKQENGMMRTVVMDEAHASSYHSSIWCAPFEALYGRKYRLPVLWAEIEESSLIGLERKSLEFEVGDRVILKVSPWKGVIRFGKKGKLASRYVGPFDILERCLVDASLHVLLDEIKADKTLHFVKEPIENSDREVKRLKCSRMVVVKVHLGLRYVGPFEILERIGPVAYQLRLPKELSGVHDTFHVSNLKKCLADASLHVPLDEIKVDKTLSFVEEPVEIMDREVKSLKRSRILLMKVHWNSKRGPEFTWEREDHMKSKYPQLFVDRAVESAMSVIVSLLWIVNSERDRLIVVDRDMFVMFERERLNVGDGEHHEDVKAKRSG